MTRLTPAQAVARAGALAAIHADAFAASGTRPWTLREMSDVARRETCAVFAADTGFLALDIVAGEAEILTFAVRTGAQGQGIGRALLEEATVWMQKCNVKRCFLEVASDNFSAISLYESAQFYCISQRKGYFRRADGRADALVMEKNLEN